MSSSGSGSLLLLVPPEIRLHIYSFLLNDGNKKWLQIRNKPPFSSNYCPPSISVEATMAAVETTRRTAEHLVVPAPPRERTSTSYHVMERTSMFHRRCHKTTYHLSHVDDDDDDDDDAENTEMHVAILSVCRLTYHEGSELLYGRHGFDFDTNIEAVVPFLQDRTPYSASLIRNISIYKRGPMPCLGSASEKHEWSYMCRFLASSWVSSSSPNAINGEVINSKHDTAVNPTRRLRLVVESGKPSQPWQGIQELAESDIRLLSLVGGHDVLEWVTDLAQVQGLAALEVVADERFLPVPKSPEMALYAAMSASIGTGLVPYLRSAMNIPDRGGPR